MIRLFTKREIPPIIAALAYSKKLIACVYFNKLQ